MAAWPEYLKYFAALLAIVNPIGSIPVFISLTAQQSPAERRKTSLLAATVVALVLLIALLTGETVLRFFAISIASFRVGGGILILLLAISMLHARMSPVRQTEEEAQDAADKESVAIVPLAIPLLAGPGAISTIILYAHRASDLRHYLMLAGEILLLALLVWGSFALAPYLARVLGRIGINIVTRIMGLIMAAIGVEFIAAGLKQLLPGLA